MVKNLAQMVFPPGYSGVIGIKQKIFREGYQLEKGGYKCLFLQNRYKKSRKTFVFLPFSYFKSMYELTQFLEDH